MRRRDFLLSSAAAGFSWLLPTGATAAGQCGPFVPPGIQHCQVGIHSGIAQVVADKQYASQWCWAACMQMVFTYYGYPISQERIVGETWGSIVNMPASPGQILSGLNRPWTDDTGDDFFVSGDVYTANHVTAAQDLAQDRPLIIGTQSGQQGHAMVLTSLRYVRDPYGRGSVTAAIVRDPWPYNPGRRVLSAQEWFSTNFLVRIRIS